MGIPMLTENLADIRLMQLISPTLPIGAFTYSQGLEWAVECGWVTDESKLENWLIGQMEDGLAYLDLPILQRQYQSCICHDWDDMQHWAEYLLASRETSELRQEEINKGRALATLLIDLKVPEADAHRDILDLTQTAGFALAGNAWQIPVEKLLLGYAWGWLENQVAAAIKLVPLGQTAGQRVQLKLAEKMPGIIQSAMNCSDTQIGASAPALAIASSLHESQYTRLFRS